MKLGKFLFFLIILHIKFYNIFHYLNSNLFRKSKRGHTEGNIFQGFISTSFMSNTDLVSRGQEHDDVPASIVYPLTIVTTEGGVDLGLLHLLPILHNPDLMILASING